MGSVSTSSSPGTFTGASLIGDEDVRGTGSELRGVNPATGATIEPAYPLVGGAEVERAASLAWDAFRSYRRTSPEQRARFLESIAVNIEALGGSLTERVMAETGIAEARVLGETVRTVNQLRLFAAVLREGDWHDARIDEAQPERMPAPRPDLRLRKIPTGPVAVFGASNFPLAFSVAGGDTASALAAGCPVVVKAHSAHPGTSELVGRAVRAAVGEHGLHEGVFSLLYGGGRDVGVELVRNHNIKSVGFTGSRSGGLALIEVAADRAEPIPVFAEMSSVNPVFIFPAALSSRAAELGAEWVASVTTGVGQLCTSPGLVFITEGDGAEAFIAAAEAAVLGTEASAMLSAGIASAFAEGVSALEARPGVARSGSGVVRGDIVASGLPQLFVADVETFLSDPRLQEEMFGPASVVITVRDSSQMVRALESLEGQLTVTVHSVGDESGVAELIDAAELKAGRLVFNGWPTGLEVGHATVHGGPFPATSQSQTTSVGALAIDRFLRPVCYQNFPSAMLPESLQDGNPLGIWRKVEGKLSR